MTSCKIVLTPATMQSPITIRFPHKIWGQIKTSNQFPGGCKYKIPFTTPLLTSFEKGSFLSQYISGEDYWIELWSISAMKDGFVELLIARPFISLTLFLKNSLSGVLLGNGIVHSPAKTYNIFYLPSGLQRMDFKVGDYVLLIAIPPIYYLQTMIAEHSGINDMLNRLAAGDKSGRHLTNFSLPHAAWRLIKKLEKTDKKGVALDIALRRYILELLDLYFGQSKQEGVNNLLLITSIEKAMAVRNYILHNLADYNLSNVNELASRFYISAKSLTKEFKVLTGQTIPRFISDERLKWAKSLLGKKELRVFEIAQLVGFTETTNFIRKFKQKFGYPPGKEAGRK